MRFKDKICVVTGGTGFIGTHLTNKLIDEGAHVKVISTHLTDDNTPTSKAEMHLCDIGDLNHLKELFTGCDYVFNLAALPRIPWTVKDPILSHAVNATGALNVLEAARCCHVHRVIHSSSCILYAPNTPYYVSKLCAEEYVRIYHTLYNLPTISLRYSTIYGKGQSKKGPHPNVIASLLKSKEDTGRVWITGDGSQSRDFVHVSDAVESNLKAALSRYCGMVDICTGINTSISEVAAYLDCPIDYVDEAKGDEKHIYSNPQRAKELIGWEAQVPLSEGIKDVIGTMQPTK